MRADTLHKALGGVGCHTGLRTLGTGCGRGGSSGTVRVDTGTAWKGRVGVGERRGGGYTGTDGNRWGGRTRRNERRHSSPSGNGQTGRLFVVIPLCACSADTHTYYL